MRPTKFENFLNKMYDYPNRCGKIHFDKIQHSFTLEQGGCQQAFSVEGQAVELGPVGVWLLRVASVCKSCTARVGGAALLHCVARPWNRETSSIWDQPQTPQTSCLINGRCWKLPPHHGCHDCHFSICSKARKRKKRCKDWKRIWGRC